MAKSAKPSAVLVREDEVPVVGVRTPRVRMTAAASFDNLRATSCLSFPAFRCRYTCGVYIYTPIGGVHAQK